MPFAVILKRSIPPGLLASALIVDSLLGWNALMGREIAGCGGTTGCDAVLASVWGNVLGVPVSLGAMLVHGILLGFVCVRYESSEQLRFAKTALSVVILSAAAWFIFVQAALIGHFCRVCLLDHLLGASAALCILGHTPKSARAKAGAWSLGLGVLIMVVVIQVIRPTAPVATDSVRIPLAVQNDATGRIVVVSPGTRPASLSELPFIGSPNAPHLIVVLFDFTCGNCRQLHPLLERALLAHPGRLCIVLLPVPIAPACNHAIANLLPEHVDSCAYACVALALWRADPATFRDFLQAFGQPDRSAPPVAKAQAWADHRLGHERFARAMADPWPLRRLQWDIEIFTRLARQSGQVKMPKIIFSHETVSGTPGGYAQFDDLLRTQAGLDE